MELRLTFQDLINFVHKYEGNLDQDEMFVAVQVSEDKTIFPTRIEMDDNGPIFYGNSNNEEYK